MNNKCNTSWCAMRGYRHYGECETHDEWMARTRAEETRLRVKPDPTPVNPWTGNDPEVP